MRFIRSIYLFNFLEDYSKFFTSAAFFGALLTFTLFIEKGTNPNLNLAVVVLQSSSLSLFILCLISLINKLRKSEAKILQIVSLLIFFVTLGLFSYLWYQYTDIVLGVLSIIFIILGIFIMNKIFMIFSSLLERKLKLSQYYFWYILFLILISLPNFYLLYNGQWGAQFVSLSDLDSFYRNVSGYLFIGLIMNTIYTVLVYLFSKIKIITFSFLKQ